MFRASSAHLQEDIVVYKQHMVPSLSIRVLVACRYAAAYSQFMMHGQKNIKLLIYLLTAIGLSPGGSSTVHFYTQTINRTTQNKQYIEQHNKFGRVRTAPRLGGLYPGICLTTEEKAWKNLSQGSRV